MRLAIAGIGHETNTFSPLRTGLDRFGVSRGAEILEHYRIEPLGGVQWVPTLCAGAMPDGLVLRSAYEALREELLSRLADAMPLDGVYMPLHGAMEVEGIGDGETDLARAVRSVVGPDALIAASLDLHANVAPAFAETTDVLTAMRTAPHVDGRETRERAIGHLVRAVREGLRPSNALLKLPLILPGEYAVTDSEPARSLYARLTAAEALPGVMDASLTIGCAWTDSPDTSVGVIVVAEGDEGPARLAARDLAAEVWARRGEFGPDAEMMPLSEAVAAAMADPDGPTIISDSGDNPTAGAAGDLPLALAELIRAGASSAVVCPFADAETVAQCSEAGEGARLGVAIGGKLDPAHEPLRVEALLRRVRPGLVVLVIGGVEVVLTAGRRGGCHMGTYEEAGIDPRQRHIVVVKQGYLSPEFRAMAHRSIWATTPGATSLRLDELPYTRLTRPIFPLDADAHWP
jgi:microcystin degradation protein MlrC